jgi:two-component system, LytTR family, sensor histidine kinase AlgZ
VAVRRRAAAKRFVASQQDWHTSAYTAILTFTRMQTRFGSSTLEHPSGIAPRSGPAPLVLPAQPEPAPVLIFDACQVGVVLRAVLFVEAVVAIGVMFGATHPLDWISRLALITGAALPATLAWLIAACALKKQLQKMSITGQWLGGISLGVLAGLYGCGVLAFIGFTQEPPWLASAAAGAAFAAALVAALVARAKGRAPASANARLAELQSRIRPHFLFNTLNSAIALVRAEPARAEAVLEDLAELFRSALVDRGDAVSLEQEIDLAKRYIDIEQVRFGPRLRVQWVIDPAARLAKVPPLLLQPLVENAVKHGVEPSTQGADIKVSTEKRGSTVVVKVTNTVPAGHGSAGHGVALRNVQDRLKLLHDVQTAFRATMVDGIYQVRIEVPA